MSEKKCICVPSGECHQGTLLGCPHKHYFNDQNVWTCILKTETIKPKIEKCICVPSGQCHQGTLLGCPHKHYFNDQNVWTCKL